MSSSNTSTTQRIIDDAAKALLYHSTIEPTWTQLPKPIKLALCKRANIHLRFIHDKLFQHTLHDIWNKNYKHHVHSITRKNTIHLECSICLESRPIDGINHTSTLLCGHHFCSQCIFKHIHTRGDNASCPMCRSHIFLLLLLLLLLLHPYKHNKLPTLLYQTIVFKSEGSMRDGSNANANDSTKPLYHNTLYHHTI